DRGRASVMPELYEMEMYWTQPVTRLGAEGW
ncbi:hypothetical protein Pgy4_37906, partial [Pseudomonas savastanoi pv. glycinea str. race 4]